MTIIARRTVILCVAMVCMIFIMLAVNVRAASANGGYPYANQSSCESGRCTYDPWGFAKRQCTSFVAWKLNATNKVAFKNDYDSNGTLDFGNADNWRAAAQKFNFRVDNKPVKGAVAWWSFGHVAWVESVKGNQVVIQEFNYDYRGNYNRRTIAGSSPTKYIHFRDLQGSVKDRYKGSIVHWNGDTKPQKTAWFVGNDGKRRWIASASTYSCLKSIGAPGPKSLSSGTLNKLPDLTGRKATCPKPSKPTSKNTLRPGQGLVQGGQITSRNGKCRLVHQGDGNTVIYHNPTKRALWATYKWSGFVVFQADGNFVGYTQLVKPTWSSQTNGKGGTRLVMQNDCNLVVYNSANKPVWASWTVV